VPYPPCTVIRQLAELKYQDPARMLRRVTQPPHIAGPLVQMDKAKIGLPPYHDSFQMTRIFSSSLTSAPLAQLLSRQVCPKILFFYSLTNYIAGQFDPREDYISTCTNITYFILYNLTVSAGQKNSNQTDSKPKILPR
jgi:hypothetical protein